MTARRAAMQWCALIVTCFEQHHQDHHQQQGADRQRSLRFADQCRLTVKKQKNVSRQNQVAECHCPDTGHQHGSGRDVLGPFGQFVILLGYQVDQCFDGGIHQFGKNHQHCGQYQQEKFQRSYLEKQRQQQNCQGGRKVITQVAFTFYRPKNPFDGAVETFQPAFRFHFAPSSDDGSFPLKIAVSLKITMTTGRFTRSEKPANL